MKKKHAGKCILFLFMVALALLYVIPFFMMGLGSFKTQAEAARFDLALPSKWLFSNYTHVLESGKIWLGYLNSIIITIPVTVISVFLGAIAGIVISRRNDKLSQGIYYYFIFGLTLTLQIASIFFLLQYLHIYGTFFSVICIFISLRIPFTVMTFCSFVKGVPREIDEASIMDGCNFWQMTIKILFPILKPIMVTNVVITAIDVWNNFMIPLFYLGSAKKINYLHGNLQLFWTLQQRLAICVCCIDAGRIANVNLFYNSSKTYYCRYDSRCCERIR